eukprot:CCRYP_010397-RA/>CCRYP_010397-RA protein AED:0.04 eAED:0.04 QI:305/1/1/1/0/0/3/3012/977
MSGHPNNANNHTYNFYDNLGTHSSLSDREKQARTAGQQSSQSSIYSSFPAGQMLWGNLAGNSNYSGASNPGNNNYHAGQQAVTWVVEQPNPQHSTNLYGQEMSSRGDQQPVTWIVEQPSHQYNHQSKTQPPQPRQQGTNVYAQNPNATTHPMQYEPSYQRSNPFSNNVSCVPQNAFKPSIGVFSSPNNDGLFSTPYISIALPHPPPPPPALPNMPHVSSRSRSPAGQPARPQLPFDQKHESDSKQQKRPRDDTKHCDQSGQRNHEPKSKRRQDKKQLRWQPPTGRQNANKGSKKLAPTAQPKKQHPKKMENDSRNKGSSVQKPPNIHQPPSYQGGESVTSGIDDPSVRMNNAVDANVAAINALSALETKWTGPGNKSLTKTQRRRRNRSKKNNLADNISSANSGSNSLHDAVDLIGNWVNIESSENKETTEDAPKEERHQTLQPTEQLNRCAAPVSINNFIDLTDDIDSFPPLPESHQKNIASSHTVDSEGHYGGFSLNEMSTSQLKSYAAVLSRAIDESKPPIALDVSSAIRPSFQPLERNHSGDVAVRLDDEMDISEDGQESEGTTKRVVVRINDNASTNMPETSSEVSNADSKESVEFIATDGSPLETVDVAATADKTSRLEEEKERYKLRLDELRAKAKLANAKLRLARKKRALGNDPPISSQCTSSSETLSNMKDQENSAKQSIFDVTALRCIKRLVIDVTSLTEPDDKLRFVESVYQDTTDDDETNVTTECAKVPPAQEARMTQVHSELTRKESESLKQKLQLAKLRLEIKKKERELELKMKQSLAKISPKIHANVGEPIMNPLRSAKPIFSQKMAADSLLATDTADDKLTMDSRLTKGEGVGIVSVADAKENIGVSEEQKIARIEELKRRQRELKQSNEVSNLRNLVQRQREILRTKGLELTESSTQLKSCVNEIKSKQRDLAASEKRLEEMNHRKRIMEGMVLRATEKLMTARTNLRETQVLEGARARS